MFLWVRDFNLNNGLRTLINTEHIVSAHDSQIAAFSGTQDDGRYTYHPALTIFFLNGNSVKVNMADWSVIEQIISIFGIQTTSPVATASVKKTELLTESADEDDSLDLHVASTVKKTDSKKTVSKKKKPVKKAPPKKPAKEETTAPIVTTD